MSEWIIIGRKNISKEKKMKKKKENSRRKS